MGFAKESLGKSSESITEIHVVWLSAGLSCDGDTIAMTAATQPSLEDLISRRSSLDTDSPFP